MIETASLYDPLHGTLVDLLRGLEPDDWSRPTVAGGWRVRDVAAHPLDGQLRRLSFHRDGHPMPPPPAGLPFFPVDWAGAAALGARALVPALHGRGRKPGETVRWRVEAEVGGTWWFARGEGGTWRLLDAPPAADAPTAGVTWSADDAWRALFNALPPAETRRRAYATGDTALVEAVLRARSVMVAPPHDDVEE